MVTPLDGRLRREGLAQDLELREVGVLADLANEIHHRVSGSANVINSVVWPASA